LFEDAARRAADSVGVIGEKGGARPGDVERELERELEGERPRWGLGDVSSVSEGIASFLKVCILLVKGIWVG